MVKTTNSDKIGYIHSRDKICFQFREWNTLGRLSVTKFSVLLKSDFDHSLSTFCSKHQLDTGQVSIRTVQTEINKEVLTFLFKHKKVKHESHT